MWVHDSLPWAAERTGQSKKLAGCHATKSLLLFLSFGQHNKE